ncbi:MAG: hypothetical protein DDT34_00504 [Firmicutes bacterium]|nr:hypothetical protein [Bacillota bacterium]
MRILLHTCCGPCSTYVVKHKQAAGHDLTGWFYNPNIHPATEHEKRMEAAKSLYANRGLKLWVDDTSNSPSNWLEAVKADPQTRCYRCYRLRLGRVAEVAATNGFDAFSTTLLISPFQKHDLIKQAGEEMGSHYGAFFHYEDLRPYFRATYQLAQELRLYRQNYCGCHYSLTERGLEHGRKKLLAGNSHGLLE